jgi:hypothetical protein
MVATSDRVRGYCAGVMHSLALGWVVGWGLSHRYDTLSPLFGPTGWLPVPLALLLVLGGFRLLLRSSAEKHAGA